MKNTYESHQRPLLIHRHFQRKPRFCLQLNTRHIPYLHNCPYLVLLHFKHETVRLKYRVDRFRNACGSERSFFLQFQLTLHQRLCIRYIYHNLRIYIIFFSRIGAVGAFSFFSSSYGWRKFTCSLKNLSKVTSRSVKKLSKIKKIPRFRERTGHSSSRPRGEKKFIFWTIR